MTLGVGSERSQGLENAHEWKDYPSDNEMTEEIDSEPRAVIFKDQWRVTWRAIAGCNLEGYLVELTKGTSFKGFDRFREDENAWSGSDNKGHRGQLSILGTVVGDKKSHYLMDHRGSISSGEGQVRV